MVKVFSNGLMVGTTQVHTLTTSNTAMVSSPGQMDKNTAANGKMANKTAKECIRIPKENSVMVSGQKAKKKNGSKNLNMKNSRNKINEKFDNNYIWIKN